MVVTVLHVGLVELVKWHCEVQAVQQGLPQSREGGGAWVKTVKRERRWGGRGERGGGRERVGMGEGGWIRRVGKEVGGGGGHEGGKGHMYTPFIPHTGQSKSIASRSKG